MHKIYFYNAVLNEKQIEMRKALQRKVEIIVTFCIYLHKFFNFLKLYLFFFLKLYYIIHPNNFFITNGVNKFI